MVLLLLRLTVAFFPAAGFASAAADRPAAQVSAALANNPYALLYIFVLPLPLSHPLLLLLPPKLWPPLLRNCWYCSFFSRLSSCLRLSSCAP
jgi:hypothetical protein